MASSFQNKGKVPVNHRWPVERISVPVHHVRWHWKHDISLQYPDVTLLHNWHVDPKRILVSAVLQSARMHAEEVSRRQRQLTREQRLNPAYVADSPNWEVWFALEHEEQRRRDVRDMQPGSPPPPMPIVSDEDREEEAAYQTALAVVLRESEEEERRKADEEEVAYEAQLAEAIALSAAGDCIVPLLPKSEPQRRSTSGPASSTSGLARRASGWARHRSRRKPTEVTACAGRARRRPSADGDG
ncbi:hypothetical protein D1007_10694 [Hordeum vulgare]|nr:hypothetical protein D1007_10694 [Hordeum vulgare]